MNNDYIVRADFYPNGEVKPLGLTNDKGETLYVKKIFKTHKISYREYVIYCKVEDEEYILILKDNRWICKNVASLSEKDRNKYVLQKYSITNNITDTSELLKGGK